MLKKAIAIPYYTIERKYWSGGLFLFFSKLGRKEFENEPKWLTISFYMIQRNYARLGSKYSKVKLYSLQSKLYTVYCRNIITTQVRNNAICGTKLVRYILVTVLRQDLAIPLITRGVESSSTYLSNVLIAFYRHT